MRYAVFSDVHSNLEAYNAVLDAMRGERIDRYCCAGDIVGYGADITACINATKTLDPIISAGNHDWGAVGQAAIDDFTANAKAAVLWTRQMLSEEEAAYLRALRLVYEDDFLLVHSSPNRPEEFEYLFKADEAYASFLRLEEQKKRVAFVGHTHRPGLFIEELGYVMYNPGPEIKLDKQKKYIINCGSIGQPRDGDPRAAYCVYDTEKAIVEIKRIGYDIEKAQKKIIEAGLPKRLAERLAIGR